MKCYKCDSTPVLKKDTYGLTEYFCVNCYVKEFMPYLTKEMERLPNGK